MTNEEYNEKVEQIKKNFEVIKKCDEKRKELERVIEYIDMKEGK